MDPIRDYIKSLRVDYNLGFLDEKTAQEDPILQFAEWMQQAIDKKANEPNAMSLATVSSNGRPSSRIVLLRNFDQDGFVFFTNYESHKAKELEANNRAALNFFWPEIHKQIRIEGKTERISEKESDEYFDSRPRESQVGAWASGQSNKLQSRAELDEKYEMINKQFDGKTISRPSFWGGFRLRPDMFEFWQGRPKRLHDRLQYRLENSQWIIQRLYP